MRRKKILVVEDDAGLRKIISSFLTDEGFEIIEAERGGEVFDKTITHKPNLILLDVMLSDIDGFEVIKTLKDSSLTADIPIIILSVLAKDKQLHPAVADYLSKPFKKEDLTKSINQVFSNLEKERAAKKKILVVDDEPDVVDIISTHLKDSGYLSLKAFDGQEAVNKARREKPDLIILDIKMPKLNGFEVIKILKNDKNSWSIPIIVLTATFISEEEKQTYLKMGVSRYLEKPFDARNLLKEIHTVLCAKKKS